MKYNTIIFDLDGTILDTLDDLAISVNYALGQKNLPLRTKEEIRMFVGNGIAKLIERAVPKGCTKEDEKCVLQIFKEHYKIHSADNTKPYDGIIDILNDLKNSGCTLAVVSNKADFAVRDLCETSFNGIFHLAIGDRDGIRLKPYPDSVNEVIEITNSKKDKTVYIGDSEVDIITAKNACLDCISVSWGFKDRDFLIKNGASVIADSVLDLKKYLE